QDSEVRPNDVAILGLAGGTAARQYTAAYGTSVQITGVEIDPEILNVAHRFFHLDEPNVRPVTAAARYWLDTDAGKSDVIGMCACRRPQSAFTTPSGRFA